MKLAILLLSAFSAAALADCLPVTGSRIAGKDLALADPRFAALPATLTVGFAPEPGAKRTYTPVELARLARANGINHDAFESVCFEVPLRQVSEEELTAAMHRSLPADAALKIIEKASVALPAGVLEFPLTGLEPPAAAAPGVQLWRGYVKYADTRRMAYWARVAVSAPYSVVIADKDLPVNAPIGAESLHVETRTGALQREKLASRIEDVEGRIPRRAVRAGAPVSLAAIAAAPAVRRGDSVTVEVQSGPAHLRFEATAESAAQDGDWLELRNPVSGKIFRARLEPGARARVIVASGQSL